MYEELRTDNHQQIKNSREDSNIEMTVLSSHNTALKNATQHHEMSRFAHLRKGEK
jgi:hypothetical protein